MSTPLQNVWLWLSSDDLKTELRQLTDEGRDVSTIRTEMEKLASLNDKKMVTPEYQARVAELFDRAGKLPMVKGYRFREPSDLKSIKAARPGGPRKFNRTLSPTAALDHIHGAWIGRCAGCFLGKAAEGVRTDRFWPFLKATGQWPLSNYIRFKVAGKLKKEFNDIASRAWADDFKHMPIDDDTNYTTTGVMIVDKFGPDFTPANVANFWMENIPLLATCTAERVAYRNFALMMGPPESATYRNPYREWIGAQIRADGFAYTALGNPEKAADFAWRDACISHVKNGIYGEMFMAAMIASAPFCKNIKALICVGLSEIPAKSRLTEAVLEVVRWFDDGESYDDAVGRIHKKWDEKTGHDWCHTISNAVICVVALLYGNEDIGDSMCKAVYPCFDTDCNGATVGSILGMRIGAKKIPAKWSGRLHNTLHTSLQGNNVVKIDEIAKKTVAAYRKVRGT